MKSSTQQRVGDNMNTTSGGKKIEDYRWDFMGFDFYKEPKDVDKWLPCPECGITPKIWVFDNGEYATCVCGKDRYNHTHRVSATPIMECIRKTGSIASYDKDKLKKNWNSHIKSL